MLPKNVIESYNATRQTADKSLLCHAPFTSINFEQNGNMTACCINRKDVLGVYPHNSITEAWQSKAADKLRGYIRENNLGGGCKLCEEHILSGNFKGTRALYYDEFAEKPGLTGMLKSMLGIPGVGLPKVFEFELSNTCNLECAMCDGYFSSSIRKNREKLPPLTNPYDAAFVDQVAEFMPYLTDMKFLGGEPFLIDIYYDIWERMIDVNPNIKVHITTNGTILNNRGKRALEKLRPGIILSIDSLDPEVYESIRVNAKFSRVMENLEYFKQLTRERETYLSFAVCPMTTNWKSLPQLLYVANKENFSLFFNTVWKPKYLSLRFLDTEPLKEVIQYLENHEPQPADTPNTTTNVKVYREFIATLRFWLNEKQEFGEADLDNFRRMDLMLAELQLPQDENTALLTGTLLCWYLEQMEPGKGKVLAHQLGGQFGTRLHATTINELLCDIQMTMDNTTFINAYFDSLTYIHSLQTHQVDHDFKEKVETLKDILSVSAKTDLAALELATTGALIHIQHISSGNVEELGEQLRKQYC